MPTILCKECLLPQAPKLDRSVGSSRKQVELIIRERNRSYFSMMPNHLILDFKIIMQMGAILRDFSCFGFFSDIFLFIIFLFCLFFLLFRYLVYDLLHLFFTLGCPVDGAALCKGETFFTCELATFKTEEHNVAFFWESALVVSHFLQPDKKSGRREERISWIQLFDPIVKVYMGVRKKFPHFEIVFEVGIGGILNRFKCLALFQKIGLKGGNGFWCIFLTILWLLFHLFLSFNFPKCYL